MRCAWCAWCAWAGVPRGGCVADHTWGPSGPPEPALSGFANHYGSGAPHEAKVRQDTTAGFPLWPCGKIGDGCTAHPHESCISADTTVSSRPKQGEPDCLGTESLRSTKRRRPPEFLSLHAARVSWLLFIPLINLAYVRGTYPPTYLPGTYPNASAQSCSSFHARRETLLCSPTYKQNAGQPHNSGAGGAPGLRWGGRGGGGPGGGG